MKKILIIKCGNTYPDIKCDYGDFDDWIIEQTNLPEKLFDIYDLPKGENLRHPDEYFAAIITGSHHNTNEKLPWIKRLKDWVISARYCNLPVLGICFGHQIIAEAFGGKVEQNEGGLNAGAVKINITPEGTSKTLFKGIGNTFESYAFNYRNVVKPPFNSTILAHGTNKMIYAFQLQSIIGVQFHPEFTEDIMEAYLEYVKNDSLDKIKVKLNKKHKNQTIISNFFDSFLNN